MAWSHWRRPTHAPLALCGIVRGVLLRWPRTPLLCVLIRTAWACYYLVCFPPPFLSERLVARPSLILNPAVLTFLLPFLPYAFASCPFCRVRPPPLFTLLRVSCYFLYFVALFLFIFGQLQLHVPLL